jgi:hypothetical protein
MFTYYELNWLVNYVVLQIDMVSNEIFYQSSIRGQVIWNGLNGSFNSY